MYHCINKLIQQGECINFNNESPIYLQLAEQIKVGILAGRLEPGAKLPSVRDVALEMRVNPNTVQRALGELEDAQLIFTERTNGKFVTNDQRTIARHRKLYATALTKEYRSKMKEIGYKI